MFGLAVVAGRGVVAGTVVAVVLELRGAVTPAEASIAAHWTAAEVLASSSWAARFSPVHACVMQSLMANQKLSLLQAHTLSFAGHDNLVVSPKT